MFKHAIVAANPYGVENTTDNAQPHGAQKVNKDATVNVIYTGTWHDPVKERAAAMALIDQGAEVIGQHVDSPTPQIVAQERGKYESWLAAPSSRASWRAGSRAAAGSGAFIVPMRVARMPALSLTFSIEARAATGAVKHNS